MRLYYHPLSSNSRRVLLTAVQLGVPLELVVVDLVNGEHKTSRYLQINPNGKVPLLEHGGFLSRDQDCVDPVAETSSRSDLPAPFTSAGMVLARRAAASTMAARMSS